MLSIESKTGHSDSVGPQWFERQCKCQSDKLGAVNIILLKKIPRDN